ncbi:MAG: valine--tRNA ligase, partial [Lentisphaerae bacterium]|nr:valine--tRNA ligase [Lentisphaerota bacterium]
NTIQDILVRWKRMQGYNTVWMPGTDHAGIATQNVVERALMKEGRSREDLGREAFVERVWQWKEEYGNTIVNQLKRLGACCDWERERFTMDEGLSRAVTEVFVRLHAKGLVYRANYIINWCPRCHTALSDEESEHKPMRGKLYYIRYPIRGKVSGVGCEVSDEEDKETFSDPKPDYVVVATTRPETLLGDVAVAIHPDDPRYADLEEKTIVLPVLGRELTVIRDDFVDPEFGTGVVKVTPAHDPNDFDMGQRHGLSSINVMNGDGTMNEEAGPYEGLDRTECRKRILHDLEEEGLLERVEDHDHSIGHCYRCSSVVEPRLSPQWFVRMKPLAEPAIEAVKNGTVTFVPARWTNVYLDWMENIRDWCISRQIWWGHRIPVFYCDGCGHEWVAQGKPETCPECGAGTVRQDEDVLDTWFSSWLWPFSTFGWPGKNDDLDFYYPTNDLVTASEIIFFWVARMIMAGLEFMGDVPFNKVYIHGTVRDDKGLKMSKSLGNSIDPLTVIDLYSADALRFSLMMITATGQDVFLSNDKFEIGRNFGTKLWNAARFILMHSDEDADRGLADADETAAIDPELLSPDDQHLLARLSDAVRDCTEALERRRFNDAAQVVYEFLWHQFCDWYVEVSKSVLSGADDRRRKQVLDVMHHSFRMSLRLLHPIMPFITEELWHVMGYGSDDESIMDAAWPVPMAEETATRLGITPETVAYVDSKHDIIRIARTLKSDYDISPSKKVAYLVKPSDADAAQRLEADRASLESLLRAQSVTIDADASPRQATPSGVSALGTVYMPIEGLVDVEAERARLRGQLEKEEEGLRRVTMKLENESFVTKAPEHVVERQRERRAELMEAKEKFERLIDALPEA